MPVRTESFLNTFFGPKQQHHHHEGGKLDIGAQCQIRLARTRLLSDEIRELHAVSFMDTSAKPAPGPLDSASHVNAASVAANAAARATAPKAEEG